MKIRGKNIEESAKREESLNVQFWTENTIKPKIKNTVMVYSSAVVVLCTLALLLYPPCYISAGNMWGNEKNPRLYSPPKNKTAEGQVIVESVEKKLSSALKKTDAAQKNESEITGTDYLGEMSSSAAGMTAVQQPIQIVYASQIPSFVVIPTYTNQQPIQYVSPIYTVPQILQLQPTNGISSNINVDTNGRSVTNNDIVYNTVPSSMQNVPSMNTDNIGNSDTNSLQTRTENIPVTNVENTGKIANNDVQSRKINIPSANPDNKGNIANNAFQSSTENIPDANPENTGNIANNNFRSRKENIPATNADTNEIVYEKELESITENIPSPIADITGNVDNNAKQSELKNDPSKDENLGYVGDLKGLQAFRNNDNEKAATISLESSESDIATTEIPNKQDDNSTSESPTDQNIHLRSRKLPLSNRRLPEEATDDDQDSSDSSGHQDSESLLDDQDSESLLDDQDSESLLDDQDSEPLLDAQDSESSSDHEESESSISTESGKPPPFKNRSVKPTKKSKKVKRSSELDDRFRNKSFESQEETEVESQEKDPIPDKRQASDEDRIVRRKFIHSLHVNGEKVMVKELPDTTESEPSVEISLDVEQIKIEDSNPSSRAANTKKRLIKQKYPHQASNKSKQSPSLRSHSSPVSRSSTSHPPPPPPPSSIPKYNFRSKSLKDNNIPNIETYRKRVSKPTSKRAPYNRADNSQRNKATSKTSLINGSQTADKEVSNISEKSKNSIDNMKFRSETTNSGNGLDSTKKILVQRKLKKKKLPEARSINGSDNSIGEKSNDAEKNDEPQYVEYSYIADAFSDKKLLCGKKMICKKEDAKCQYKPTQLNTENKKAFVLGNEVDSWKAAEKCCTKCGWKLAEILSESENKFVKTLTNSSFWIGASRADSKVNWTWSSGAPFRYSDLSSKSKPDVTGYNRECLKGGPDGWSISDCNQSRKFFCHIDC